MEKFLINMAVVKVNWDRSQQDILDNYIPLVAHALQQHNSNTLSLEEFKIHFRNVSEFDIPTGAIISLLKRASKKHGLVQKNAQGIFEINREKVDENSYSQTRERETRRYNQMKTAFCAYCKEYLNVNVSSEDADEYFFETLYEIAPALFARVSDIEHIGKVDVPEKQYLVGRFVGHVAQNDDTSFDAIVSFVRGAMLTETFYYSHPGDIPKKMREVRVFFDTVFLLRVLGYCDDMLSEPCRELIEMLRAMGVRMRVFPQTRDEIIGILNAAAFQLRTQRRLIANRPGDAFDYFNSCGYTNSDVELAIAKLNDNLSKRKIFIEETPEHTEDFGVDENKLSERIKERIPGQSEAARNHDVDCLAAIHRLRHARPMEYLESCVAIFITTNASVASVAAEFFSTEHGRSNVPVCMGDQVFTTLIWMKAVKKMPDLPKEQLVAQCYAATQPSEGLWAKYVAEAEKLRAEGGIEEGDYAVLIHGLEARQKLMDLTLGEGEIVQGTVRDVLESAKSKYTEKVREELTKTKHKERSQAERLATISKSIGNYSYRIVLICMLIIWISVLGAGLTISFPDAWSWGTIFSLESWLFLVFSIITLLNLIFGFRIFDHCRSIAANAGSSISQLISRYLSP